MRPITDLKKYVQTEKQRADVNLQNVLRANRELLKAIVSLFEKKPDIDVATVHKYISSTYPTLTKQYPAVIASMVNYRSYSEHAFIQMIEDLGKALNAREKDKAGGEKLTKEKAMREFIHINALYEKRRYLYTTVHPSAKIAGKIYTQCSEHMGKTFREMEKESEKTGETFEEKQAQYLRERIEDYKRFIVESAAAAGKTPAPPEDEVANDIARLEALLKRKLELEEIVREEEAKREPPARPPRPEPPAPPADPAWIEDLGLKPDR